jgi:YesN/AraC family two-component response regulator
MIISFCKHHHINPDLFINEGVVRGDIISTFGNNSDIADYIYCLIEKILQTEKTTILDIKQLVHETERYINTHFYEDISLNAIAERNHVDLKHLSKVFKSIVGSPFSEYLMEVRLKRAVELLSTTDMEIQEIARSVGYADHQYFHRLFKKKMNMTPNQYRMLQDI